AGTGVKRAQTTTSGGQRSTTTTRGTACILRNVRQKQLPLDQRLMSAGCSRAMEIQADLDKWVRFQLAEATGQNSAKNPAQVKKAGR
ncbi:unnamed protein product, partial [Ectocarpus sp. 12 AP-2014]